MVKVFKYHCFLFLLAVFVTSLLMPVQSNAQEDADFRTPDTWSKHANPGEFKEMAKGIELGEEARLNLSLTSRYRLRTNDYDSDQNFYQYLRASVDPVELGDGSVYANLFLRGADDLDGKDPKNFYIDILDTELEYQELAPRLFQGNITFDEVISSTKFKLGRQYASHINTLQIDGLDLAVSLGEMANIYIYGGAPVSYFYEVDNDLLYGAGIEIAPFTDTKIKVEYVRLEVEDLEDSLLSVRLDQAFSSGYFYGLYTSLDYADDTAASLEGGILYRLESTRTFLKLRYKGQYDEVGDMVSYPINPISITLLPYGKYNTYNGEISQGIGNHFMLALGAEIKDAGGQIHFDNRDYTRYYGNIDMTGIPGENTYISISAELWTVDENEEVEKNEKFQYGGRLGHKLAESVDVWAGTTYYRYKYNELTAEKSENVRYYYIGGQWNPNDTIGLLVDFSAENSEMFEPDPDLEDNYAVEAWLNIVF